jgi:hypothetical protein
LQQILGFAVQFDESRDRYYYGLKELKYFRNLIRDFFSYYQDFNYQEDIICTYTGTVIDKDYYPYNIEKDCAMTIASPLLRRVNCAKYLSNFDLANFYTVCHFSCTYLDNYKVPKSLLKYYDDDYY